MAAIDFQYEEFNEGTLQELENWDYDGWKYMLEPPYTLEVPDREAFSYLQDGRLYHLWRSEEPTDHSHYYGQAIKQGQTFDPDADPPYGAWTFVGITGPIDVYTKVALPDPEGMGTDLYGGGNFQTYIQDFVGYYGVGIWVYFYDDVDSTWQWVLSSWVSGYDDGYEESVYIGLGAVELEIWVRLTWPLDGSESMIYYSLSQPLRDSDWIPLMPITPYPFIPNGVDLPYYEMYSQGNSYDLPRDLLVGYEYFREWPPVPDDAPSLDQYQRLQGYPKVIHPLVFNRETGGFEVLAQSETLPPRPPDNPDHTLGYDGNGNLSTIDMLIGAITYRKTLTYTAGNLTGVSVWVEQ